MSTDSMIKELGVPANSNNRDVIMGRLRRRLAEIKPLVLELQTKRLEEEFSDVYNDFHSEMLAIEAALGYEQGRLL